MPPKKMYMILFLRNVVYVLTKDDRTHGGQDLNITDKQKKQMKTEVVVASVA
jgi:hypothetical protein